VHPESRSDKILGKSASDVEYSEIPPSESFKRKKRSVDESSSNN